MTTRTTALKKRQLKPELAGCKILAQAKKLEDPYRIPPDHSPIIQDQSKTPVPEAAQNWPPASPGPEPRPKAAGPRTSQRVYEQKAAAPHPTEQAAPGAPQHKT